MNMCEGNIGIDRNSLLVVEIHVWPNFGFVVFMKELSFCLEINCKFV